jgi:hypothetical protein
VLLASFIVAAAVLDNVGAPLIDRHLAVIDGAFVKPCRFCLLNDALAHFRNTFQDTGNDYLPHDGHTH